MENKQALLAAHKRQDDFLGPRGLQRLVADRRRNGVLLPFTVSMRLGSRVALTKSTLDDTDADNEDDWSGSGSSSVDPSLDGKGLSRLKKEVCGVWGGCGFGFVEYFYVEMCYCLCSLEAIS